MAMKETPMTGGDCLSLDQVTDQDVKLAIKKLKSKTTSGPDLLSHWFLYVRAAKAKFKTTVLGLADFREEVAVTICQMGTKTTPKRGRPTQDLDLALVAKKESQMLQRFHQKK
ncbi:hypothetical protein J6590_065891 [Homalodisca vitripennis]|nr:hypothetical protein J6590_065891 [Homalodisca vitripennis]